VASSRRPDGGSRRTAALLLLAASLLAGCDSGPVASATASPSRASGAVSATASALQAGPEAAEQLYLKSEYTAAEGAYGSLLARRPRDPRVLSSHAIFLTYTGRLTEAAVDARAAVEVAPDAADGHGALCRILDWQGRVDAAAAECRLALAGRGAGPATRLLASEAAADGGDLATAAAQLDAARQGSPGPHLAAEIERVAGNLAGATGDREGQLKHLEAAMALERHWSQRLAEVSQTAGLMGHRAEAAAAAAGAAAITDPEALRLVADATLVGEDAPAASVLYHRALAAGGDGPELLEGLAAADVAARIEIPRAIATLEELLRRYPGRWQVQVYLDAVRQTFAGGPVPAVAPEMEAERGRALVAVNSLRSAAGLPPVTLSSALSRSALGHVLYWLVNAGDPAAAALGIHREQAGHARFSGASFVDRARAAGYPSSQVGEDITHRGSPEGAVGDWRDSVYHRFPMVRRDLVALGYAGLQVGPLAMEDMEFGLNGSAGAAADPVLIPAPGATEVPRLFIDNELPDPVPPGRPRTTGYPVTATFAAGSQPSGASLTLWVGDHQLPAYTIGASPTSENSISAIAVSPLPPGTVVRAHLVAGVGGNTISRDWSFTTA
jgi:tetratricopeptide (TPR) repeat protein